MRQEHPGQEKYPGGRKRNALAGEPPTSAMATTIETPDSDQTCVYCGSPSYFFDLLHTAEAG